MYAPCQISAKMFSVVIKVYRSLLAVASCIGYIYYSTF